MPITKPKEYFLLTAANCLLGEYEDSKMAYEAARKEAKTWRKVEVHRCVSFKVVKPGTVVSF